MSAASTLTTATGDAPPARSLRIEVSARTLLYVTLIGIGVWLAWQLWTVVVILVVALVLVGTLDPMVAWLERRRLSRPWALGVVFVALAVVLGGILFLSIPPLLAELQQMVENLPEQRDKLIALLDQEPWSAPFSKQVESVPVNEIVVRAASYSFDLLAVVGYGVTTLFLAIYLLADPRHAKGLLYAAVPRIHHVKLARVILELKVIVGGYMRGQVITSVAITVFMFVLMSALGVKDALAIAIFAGMTDIIPFVGGYVATAPTVIAVCDRGALTMVGVFIVGMLYQEFESRILVPRVYGRVLRLSPALVLLSLLAGGTLLGVLGALLALPIAAGMQMLVRELRVEMPGQPDLEQERERDELAGSLYEKLTEGTPAADAQVIAGELAQKIKQTEQDGRSLTAELPVIAQELASDAREVAAKGAHEEAEARAADDEALDRAPPASPEEPKRAGLEKHGEPSHRSRS